MYTINKLYICPFEEFDITGVVHSLCCAKTNLQCATFILGKKYFLVQYPVGKEGKFHLMYRRDLELALTEGSCNYSTGKMCVSNTVAIG